MFAGAGQERVRRKQWLFDCLPNSRCSAETYLPSMGGLFPKAFKCLRSTSPTGFQSCAKHCCWAGVTSSSSDHLRWVQPTGDPGELTSGGTSSVPLVPANQFKTEEQRKNLSSAPTAAVPNESGWSCPLSIAPLVEWGYFWRKKNEIKKSKHGVKSFWSDIGEAKLFEFFFSPPQLSSAKS